MGNALCLSQRDKKETEYATARVSPIPAFRKRRRPSGDAAPHGTLQDLCVKVVASNASGLDISVLPAELIQRVADHLVDEGKLDASVLPHTLTPWTDTLRLSKAEGVDDAWMARVAPCLGLRVLDITNCNMVTSAGLLSLSPLRQLVVLRAGNCLQIGDNGMATIAGMTKLQELSLEGCEAITDRGASALSNLVALTSLNLGKCASLGPGSLSSISNLGHLRQLNLGWCRGIGVPSASSKVASSYLRSEVVRSAGLVAAALPAAIEVAVAIAAGGADPGGHAQVPGALAAAVAGAAGFPMTGPLAPLAALTGLTDLNLCATKIGDSVLAPLAALTGLTALDLSGNRHVTMRGLAAALLRPTNSNQQHGSSSSAGSLVCPRISRLRLRDCGIPDGGRGFEGLAELAGPLRSLDLSCTRVGSRGLLQLGALTGLTELLLDMCPVADGGCQVFSSLTNLEHLDLSDTEVSSAGAFHLSKLPRLARLGLCDTDVGDGAVAALTGLSRLSSLNLDAKRVTDESLHLLLPLARGIKELDLYGAKVTLRGASALPAYIELTHLFLCGGWMTDRAACEVAKLPKLQHLSLAQNARLTDAAVKALAAGRCRGTLEALNLTGTGVGDGCVPVLAAMPALAVVALSNTAVSRAAVDHLRRTTSLLVKYSAPGGAGGGGGGAGGGAGAT